MQREKIAELEEQKKENWRLLVGTQVRVNALQEQLRSQTQKSQEEMEMVKRNHETELYDLKNKQEKTANDYQQLAHFVSIRQQMQQRIKDLERQCKEDKDRYEQAVQELDREKIQTTEKLKKDMLHKIKQTKNKLMMMSDEQLHTTTRLTVLENHKLTTELEYQSKQTEKLLSRNQQLANTVTGLRRDVEVHRQVEEELAKRSHHHHKVNKHIKEKLRKLEETCSIQSYEQESTRSVDLEHRLLQAESTAAMLRQELKQAEEHKEALQKTQLDQELKQLIIDFLEAQLKDSQSEHKATQATWMLRQLQGEPTEKKSKGLLPKLV